MKDSELGGKTSNNKGPAPHKVSQSQPHQQDEGNKIGTLTSRINYESLHQADI